MNCAVVKSLRSDWHVPFIYRNTCNNHLITLFKDGGSFIEPKPASSKEVFGPCVTRQNRQKMRLAWKRWACHRFVGGYPNETRRNAANCVACKTNLRQCQIGDSQIRNPSSRLVSFGFPSKSIPKGDLEAVRAVIRDTRYGKGTAVWPPIPCRWHVWSTARVEFYYKRGPRF